LLPSVKVGDTTSVMKVVDVMKENLTVNQYKILNTHVIDPYGFGIVRDLLNISLVETGFCPNIDIQEFQSRLASVGAQFPAIGNINNKRAKRANYKKGLVAPKVE
jgi:hypothetical protein